MPTTRENSAAHPASATADRPARRGAWPPDVPAALVGSSLVVGSLLAVLLWLPIRLLPGGFSVIDAPSFQEGVEIGLWNGAVGSVLVVLAVGCATAGAMLLRQGRTAPFRPVLTVVLGASAAAAAAQQAWLLSAACAVVLVVVLLVLRGQTGISAACAPARSAG